MPSPKNGDWRDAPKVRAWEASLRRHGASLNEVEPLNLLKKSDGNLLFALVRAQGKDSEGKPLMPYALLRGPACVVVPVCKNSDTGESRFLMIRHRRIGHGGLSLEFPAGMLDENLADPVATALRELEEETGLRVDRSALTPLWPQALYSSPGLSDESVYFYAVEVGVDAKTWENLEGGSAGHEGEGEFITTTLRTYAQASTELTSLQALLGFLLYSQRFGEAKPA